MEDGEEGNNLQDWPDLETVKADWHQYNTDIQTAAAGLLVKLLLSWFQWLAMHLALWTVQKVSNRFFSKCVAIKFEKRS